MNAEFAGITYPKPLWTLDVIPRDPVARAKRLEDRRHPVTSGYYMPSPKILRTRDDCTTGGYHEKDGPASGMRWQWCDDVDGRPRDIAHGGWYTDNDRSSGTLRGFVARLPHGRGYLVGWSMGEGMCCHLDYTYVWSADDSVGAAVCADDCARLAAEQERDFQEQEREREHQGENDALGIPWSASDIEPGTVIDCDGTGVCEARSADIAALICTAVNAWRADP